TRQTELFARLLLLPSEFGLLLFSRKSSPRRSSTNVRSISMSKQLFRRPFPPPSPAKHIKAVLMWRHGSMKPN
ncbi:hypothetical protein PanWU01x14_364060, partial [Parasponia andersonii]